MAEITEIQLPGVGVRYEFTSADGDNVGVICHHGGRREIVVYAKDDPDRAQSVTALNADDSRTLSELLGASQVTEAMSAVEQRIEGLALDWLEIEAGSPLDGRTIGDGQLRTRTGTSVVAVIRGDSTEPAPGPEYVFHAGDVAVAVGTPDGLEQLRHELKS
ncbi:MAG: cation:proton antiporter regulatory subunit [Acidimicrobiales bacterium]|nr:cation:proton antiporter regulatory subunit [Acidimicrobiales bacterium]